MWVLLEPGDSAVVPSPSYPIHLVAPRLAGATVVARADRERRLPQGVIETLERSRPRPAS